jgi:glycosyltransferase A (GT-A) superfamily protein (DUF2064 family)
VLGPSDDGGYYLIGMRDLRHELFRDIDWSTDRVLTQTLERARDAEIETHLLPVGFDVDDRTSLRRLCDELLGGQPTTESGSVAVATRSYLASIVEQEGRARIWPRE